MNSVGFGFGDAVIVELLKMKSLLPDFSASSTDVVVYSYDQKYKLASIQLSSQLRSQDIATELVLLPKKVKAVFEHASRIQASKCL